MKKTSKVKKETSARILDGLAAVTRARGPNVAC